jgi:hypothetical protein
MRFSGKFCDSEFRTGSAGTGARQLTTQTQPASHQRNPQAPQAVLFTDDLTMAQGAVDGRILRRGLFLANAKRCEILPFPR